MTRLLKIPEVLRGTEFVKVAGPAGDWIVLINCEAHDALDSHHIQPMTDRRHGIGANTVISLQILTTQNALASLSLKAWDSHGQILGEHSEAARVATHVVGQLQGNTPDKSQYLTIVTPSGAVNTVYTPGYVGVDIGHWSYKNSSSVNDGADMLVMAAGLVDPRPGLSIKIQELHVTVAVESQAELDKIDLEIAPSLEPQEDSHEISSVAFVVPQEPLLQDGAGHLILRAYNHSQDPMQMVQTSAAAVLAFQTWSGLEQLSTWTTQTPDGEIMIQLHEDNRVSTFLALRIVFRGTI